MTENDIIPKFGALKALDERQQAWIDALDKDIKPHWGLGRNLILVWSTKARAIDVLVIPHYTISEHVQRSKQEAERYGQSAIGLTPTSFIEEVIANPKHVTREGMKALADFTGYDPVEIPLAFQPGVDLDYEHVEDIIKRYSISYVEDRAVALFDIVGFSLFSALEQVTQLNSLAYSVNSAFSKMLKKEIDISFARSTTGDGFYIWNRDRSIQANVNLYHFMHLVLADNAIAMSKSSASTTPRIRACFHLGSHYEFYQSEGLSPTIYSYIVGDVTIELARMIERALPGQILVGDFKMPTTDAEIRSRKTIDSREFIKRTEATLSSLDGLELSDDEIDGIQCYLTGEKKLKDDEFAIKRYLISDKHGKTRYVYNAKVNIYRTQAEPIFLGVQTSDLEGFDFVEEEFV